MNLRELTRRLEAMEARIVPKEPAPHRVVTRIIDGGTIVSQELWENGKLVEGWDGVVPPDTRWVLNRIIVDPPKRD
jgi:hypothetical protein